MGAWDKSRGPEMHLQPSPADGLGRHNLEHLITELCELLMNHLLPQLSGGQLACLKSASRCLQELVDGAPPAAVSHLASALLPPTMLQHVTCAQDLWAMLCQQRNVLARLRTGNPQGVQRIALPEPHAADSLLWSREPDPRYLVSISRPAPHPQSLLRAAHLANLQLSSSPILSGVHTFDAKWCHDGEHLAFVHVGLACPFPCLLACMELCTSNYTTLPSRFACLVNLLGEALTKDGGFAPDGQAAVWPVELPQPGVCLILLPSLERRLSYSIPAKAADSEPGRPIWWGWAATSKHFAVAWEDLSPGASCAYVITIHEGTTGTEIVKRGLPQSPPDNSTCMVKMSFAWSPALPRLLIMLENQTGTFANVVLDITGDDWLVQSPIDDNNELITEDAALISSQLAWSPCGRYVITTQRY